MRRLIVCSLLTLVAAFYVAGLDFSPVYLLNDEIHGALQALSLATTGRSTAGDFLPLYFRESGFPAGRDPAVIYSTALSFKVLPLSEVSVRLPTAMVGVCNVILAYFIGRRLGGNRRFGVLTAGMLALTPAHFIHSRIGIATLWSIPFFLGWLLGLAHYDRSRHSRTLFLAMLCLGMAAYGYVGSAVLIPLYFVASLAFLFWGLHERSVRAYAMAFAGFLLPLTFLVYWQLVHPERWSELFAYYLVGPSAVGANDGGSAAMANARGLLNFAAIQERVTAYWNYFDPSFLFLAGDDSLRYSTGRAGVFLLASALLLPVGIYQALHTPGIGMLMVFCFFCSPVVGAMQGQIQIQRALPLVLFGSLLSAWGAAWFMSHANVRLRFFGALLALFVTLQFVVFAVDYFGHYRLRSGAHRGGNLRGAIVEVVQAARQSNSPAILLSENIPNVDLYWRFYTSLLGVPDLESRGLRSQPSGLGLEPVPSGALLISTSQEVPSEHPSESNSWRLRKRIYELDGPTFYSVYEKIK